MLVLPGRDGALGGGEVELDLLRRRGGEVRIHARPDGGEDAVELDREVGERAPSRSHLGRFGRASGIGSALFERFEYDEDGNPLTTTFLDYLIPTSTDVPNVEIEHLGIPTTAPGGYKGVGEGGAIGAVPAVRNAVADALGTSIDGPIRPGDVVEALQAEST